MEPDNRPQALETSNCFLLTTELKFGDDEDRDDIEDAESPSMPTMNTSTRLILTAGIGLSERKGKILKKTSDSFKTSLAFDPSNITHVQINRANSDGVDAPFFSEVLHGSMGNRLSFKSQERPEVQIMSGSLQQKDLDNSSGGESEEFMKQL